MSFKLIIDLETSIQFRLDGKGFKNVWIKQ
jgi:hypothetical protein